MYLITNRHLTPDLDTYLSVIEDAVSSGVKNVIVREKDMDDLEFKDLYLDIVKRVSVLPRAKDGVNLIINNKVEAFRSLQADGLQLSFGKFIEMVESGERFEEFSVEKNKILGLSIHSVDEVNKLIEVLKEIGPVVEYITVSHIFSTDCKKGLVPKGIEFIKEVKEVLEQRYKECATDAKSEIKTETEIKTKAKTKVVGKEKRKIKIIALGGIIPTNVSELENEANDYAVMSTVMKSKNVRKTILDYNASSVG
ncbi:MAG: thiamine phosphate synthase [Clostridioides sp.]|jgi:thiamine-phosphate pyrophosphorylase|nr:thiamine phosphate synthase [Clostridioides sp.]